MRKLHWCKDMCSIVIVCVLIVFLFSLRYDTPLTGDDVGGLVINNPDSSYLDNAEIQGECTLDLDYSWDAVWNRIESSYFLWGGAYN